MKKTVFKGTINGKEFNNVQEYNKEMMRLLTSNEKVEANAETKTIDDDTCSCNCNGCDCECCCEDCCGEKGAVGADYTPFVTTKHGDYYITLDDIIDSCQESEDKLNEETDSIRNYLNENYETLIKAIQNWSEQDLEKYADEIDNILVRFDAKNKYNNEVECSLKAKQKNYEERIKILQNTLDKVSKRAKIVEKGSYIYNKVSDFYVMLANMIEEVHEQKKPQPTEKAKENITTKSPKVTAKEKKPQKEINLSDIFGSMSLNEYISNLQKTINSLKDEKNNSNKPNMDEGVYRLFKELFKEE